MKDFETHDRGTYEEIRLSRALAQAIESEIEAYGDVVPYSVRVAYDRLYNHYVKMIQQEDMEPMKDMETKNYE